MGGHGNTHATSFYVKIWGLLLVLLTVSIVGPMFGHKWLTLITAFGIAIVKAYIVAANFMHLNIEKKYISYMLLTMVVLLGMLFFGSAADVMKNHGSNWVKAYHEQAVPVHSEQHQ